jgi:hypothetical protein
MWTVKAIHTIELDDCSFTYSSNMTNEVFNDVIRSVQTTVYNGVVVIPFQSGDRKVLRRVLGILHTPS